MWEAFNFADINLMQILSTKAALVIVLAMSTYKILFCFNLLFSHHSFAIQFHELSAFMKYDSYNEKNSKSNISFFNLRKIHSMTWNILCEWNTSKCVYLHVEIKVCFVKFFGNNFSWWHATSYPRWCLISLYDNVYPLNNGLLKKTF